MIPSQTCRSRFKECFQLSEAQLSASPEQMYLSSLAPDTSYVMSSPGSSPSSTCSGSFSDPADWLMHHHNSVPPTSDSLPAPGPKTIKAIWSLAKRKFCTHSPPTNLKHFE